MRRERIRDAPQVLDVLFLYGASVFAFTDQELDAFLRSVRVKDDEVCFALPHGCGGATWLKVVRRTEAHVRERLSDIHVKLLQYKSHRNCTSGTCDVLSTQIMGPATGESAAEARFLIPKSHSASIFLGRFVRSKEEGDRSRVRVINVLGVPVRFAFDSEANVLSISAICTPALPAHMAENWFGEPLRILFGQLVYPRLVERRFPEGESFLSVRQSPAWAVRSAWTALWIDDDKLTNDTDFFYLYAALLALIARDGHWESHPITKIYEEVIQSARGSRWVMVLTLASSIEAWRVSLSPGAR